MDLKQVEALIKVMKKHAVNEIELEEGDTRVRVAMGGATYSIPALSQKEPPPVSSGDWSLAPATDTSTSHNYIEVRSPFVGTFYEAASPDSAPFVKVGSKIKKGSVLCIIEAMKLMNEIESDAEGAIAKILVKNGDSVEFDQVLFYVE